MKHVSKNLIYRLLQLFCIIVILLSIDLPNTKLNIVKMKTFALNNINNAIAECNVIIQKYKNNDQQKMIKELLIKRKISKKIIEEQLSNDIQSVIGSDNQAIKERLAYLDETIEEMVSFENEFNAKEMQAENRFKQKIDELETIKIYLSIYFEEKTEIKAISIIEQFNLLQQYINNDVIPKIEKIKKEIHQIDAEIEVTRTIERKTLKLKSN
jgi:hypothetical protein